MARYILREVYDEVLIFPGLDFLVLRYHMNVAAVFHGLRYSVRIYECVQRERFAGFIHAGPYSILFALHFDKGTTWMGVVIGRGDGRVLL